MSETDTPDGSRAPRGGLSLIEVMVALSLTLTILLIALGLLQLLRRSFLKTELASDAQQRARIAQETISHDLRLAGVGVDPDGADGRPDEAIEGAWAGAIVARGDLDAGDAQDRDDPESWIAGVFPSTRTGNDEIFAYALRYETGSGGADLSFDADVASTATVTTASGLSVAPRDGLVEAVTLTRVVAGTGGSAGPKGMLYRASVANNASVWGTGNAISWQPLSDGVASLGFRYFDESGNEVAPAGGAEAGSSLRARIALVEVHVVVLESRADLAWSDPLDTDPLTKHYRKVDVRFTVSLRGARLRGAMESG